MGHGLDRCGSGQGQVAGTCETQHMAMKFRVIQEMNCGAPVIL